MTVINDNKTPSADRNGERDDMLRCIFDAYRPRLGDSEEFLRRLSLKLEAAEYIQKNRHSMTALTKRLLLLTFAMGLALGAGAASLALYMKNLAADIRFSAPLMPDISIPAWFIQITASSLACAGIIIAAAGIFYNVRRLRRDALPEVLSGLR